MARNMLAENQSVKRAQDAGIYFSGWVSLVLAIVGGVYLSASWVGDVLRALFGLLPGWVITAMLILGFIGWVYDIFNDLVPNQTAVTFAVLGPTIAGSSQGKLAANILQWAEVLRSGVGGRITPWIGNLGATGLALVCCGAAIIIAKRTLQKQSAAGGRGAGGGR